MVPQDSEPNRGVKWSREDLNLLASSEGQIYSLVGQPVAHLLHIPVPR